MNGSTRCPRSQTNCTSRSVPTFALFGVLAIGLTTTAWAGPFTDPGIPGLVSGSVNPVFQAWADGVVDFTPTPGVTPENGDPTKALGPVTTTTSGETVSLGDLSESQITSGDLPGSLTLSFSAGIKDEAGTDFAVFENAFTFFPPDDDKVFAELAYVEVSSNGVDFARLPSTSLTTTLFAPFGPDFAGIDPTDVNNLAGKHESLIGTEFDLADLTGHPAVVGGYVDLSAIYFVRLIDIPGSGDFFDDETPANPILDAWDTTSEFGNGGIDVDAVGVIHAVPEPTALISAGMGLAVLLMCARRWRR